MADAIVARSLFFRDNRLYFCKKTVYCAVFCFYLRFLILDFLIFQYKIFYR